jgi:hypothetical protein
MLIGARPSVRLRPIYVIKGVYVEHGVLELLVDAAIAERNRSPWHGNDSRVRLLTASLSVIALTA